jgi:ribosomal protein L1
MLGARGKLLTVVPNTAKDDVRAFIEKLKQ